MCSPSRLLRRLEMLWIMSPVLRPDEICQVLTDSARKDFASYITYLNNQPRQHEALSTLK